MVSLTLGLILTGLAKVNVLWSTWNIQAFVLGSFIFQCFLSLASPFRKKTSNGLVAGSIWLAYLSAEYIAIQGSGLIPKKANALDNSNRNTSIIGSSTSSAATTATASSSQLDHLVNSDILALWASFLLLHQGGPDTITALSLEDNELWFRSVLQLGVQLVATGRVFFQSLQGNTFWAPTVLILLAGILKWVERTLSLYHASANKFWLSNSGSRAPLRERNWMVMMEYAEDEAYEEEEMDEEEMYVKGELSDVELVEHAFQLFQHFKGLYVDVKFNENLYWKSSRDYFLMRSPKEAFTVVEMELNFAYEGMYTKAIVMHKKFGKVSKAISFLLQVSSLVIWCLTTTNKKISFHPYDLRLTYTLLVGAIAIDVISYLRLWLSEWTIGQRGVSDETKKGFATGGVVAYSFLSCLRRSTPRLIQLSSSGPGWTHRILFRRWSELIPQFNLIDYCVKKPESSQKLNNFMDAVGIKHIFEEWVYVSNKWFTKDLRDFIFYELERRSYFAEDLEFVENHFWKARGDWILKHMGMTQLENWTTSFLRFEESLLIWHIATEMCYRSEVLDERDLEDVLHITVNDREINNGARSSHNTASAATTDSPPHNDDHADAIQEEEDHQPGEGNQHQLVTEICHRPEVLTEREDVLDININDQEINTDSGSSHNTDVAAATTASPPLPPPTRTDDQADIIQEEKDHRSGKENQRQPHMDLLVLENGTYRELSKTLSDYMLYLLLRRPNMISTVAGTTEVIFQETCEDVMRDMTNEEGMQAWKLQAAQSRSLRYYRGMPVLDRAFHLACELRALNDNNRTWEVIAKVWAELLFHAAIRSNPKAHAARLKEGGELLTLVWLLAVHFGLGKQFRR